MNSNESPKSTVSRRTAVAAGLAPLVVARHVLGGAGYQAPSDKLRIACVGVGGVGEDYVAGCKNEEIVALCDLDHEFAAPVWIPASATAMCTSPERGPRPSAARAQFTGAVRRFSCGTRRPCDSATTKSLTASSTRPTARSGTTRFRLPSAHHSCARLHRCIDERQSSDDQGDAVHAEMAVG